MKRLLMPFVRLVRGERKTHRSLNIIKTIFVNFKALPFSQARHLPIFIYSGTRIYHLGKITINSPQVTRGMISIGKIDFKSQGHGKIFNLGEIRFEGPVIIGGGVIIENLGCIILHGQNFISEGVTLLIRDRLEIGCFSRIGFRCFFMDSDDHFTINCKDLSIRRNKQPIIIGQYNWIAGRTHVKKGAVTPDYTIVASAHTLLTKDYSNIEKYSVLGGIPAKVIGQGIRRIHNWEAEQQIYSYFNANPDKDIYIADISPEEIDDYCLSNALHF